MITGAGIGDLITALWLHHLGIDCQVYEQGKSIGELVRVTCSPPDPWQLVPPFRPRS
jgi:2-polyprenyl-6-methoxyphenol hydroxylase-like FAD-dependent oxidoreductase